MGERPRVELLDCVDFMKSMPDESVDLLITDPAYESLEKHRSVGTTTRLTKSWFPIFKNDRFQEFFPQIQRVMKKDSHCYLFCDEETADVVKPIIKAMEGFTFWKTVIWFKQSRGTGYHYANSHEGILFFERGHRQLNNQASMSVLSYARVRNGYPTEKPQALIELLVQNSSHPGDLVLDPFLGSGVTGVAALRNQRRFAGCDVNPESLQRFFARAGAYIPAEDGTCRLCHGPGTHPDPADDGTRLCDSCNAESEAETR